MRGQPHTRTCRNKCQECIYSTQDGAAAPLWVTHSFIITNTGFGSLFWVWPAHNACCCRCSSEPELWMKIVPERVNYLLVVRQCWLLRWKPFIQSIRCFQAHISRLSVSSLTELNIRKEKKSWKNVYIFWFWSDLIYLPNEWLCVFYTYSSFLTETNNMRIKLIRGSKLPRACACECVSCLWLSGRLDRLHHPPDLMTCWGLCGSRAILICSMVQNVNPPKLDQYGPFFQLLLLKMLLANTKSQTNIPNYCFKSQNHVVYAWTKKQKWWLSKHQTCQNCNQILLLRVQFWKLNIFTHYFLRRFSSRRGKAIFFNHVWPQNRSQAWLMKQRRRDLGKLIIACFKLLSKQCFDPTYQREDALKNLARRVRVKKKPKVLDHTVAESTQANDETPNEENRSGKNRPITTILEKDIDTYGQLYINFCNLSADNSFYLFLKTKRIILEWLYFDFGRNNFCLYKCHQNSEFLKLNCSRFTGHWLYRIRFGSGMSSSVSWQNLAAI